MLRLKGCVSLTRVLRGVCDPVGSEGCSPVPVIREVCRVEPEGCVCGVTTLGLRGVCPCWL